MNTNLRAELKLYMYNKVQSTKYKLIVN